MRGGSLGKVVISSVGKYSSSTPTAEQELGQVMGASTHILSC